MLRNAFSSDLDLPKANNFHSAPAMVGPPVATKPWNFYFSRAFSLVVIALGKFRSPGDCF